MAQYHVKNGSALDKAFKVYGGHHIVSAGKEGDVLNAAELTEAQIADLAAAGIKIKVIEASDEGAFMGGRDGNSDTPEMAQLRTQFDAEYASLKAEHDRAVGILETACNENEDLKARITSLEAEVKAKGDELAALQAGAQDNGARAPFVVLDKGRGWWAITQDNKEVTKSLREDDVKDFAGLDFDKQSAFVEANKPE